MGKLVGLVPQLEIQFRVLAGYVGKAFGLLGSPKQLINRLGLSLAQQAL